MGRRLMIPTSTQNSNKIFLKNINRWYKKDSMSSHVKLLSITSTIKSLNAPLLLEGETASERKVLSTCGTISLIDKIISDLSSLRTTLRDAEKDMEKLLVDTFNLGSSTYGSVGVGLLSDNTNQSSEEHEVRSHNLLSEFEGNLRSVGTTKIGQANKEHRTVVASTGNYTGNRNPSPGGPGTEHTGNPRARTMGASGNLDGRDSEGIAYHWASSINTGLSTGDPPNSFKPFCEGHWLEKLRIGDNWDGTADDRGGTMAVGPLNTGKVGIKLGDTAYVAEQAIMNILVDVYGIVDKLKNGETIDDTHFNAKLE